MRNVVVRALMVCLLAVAPLAFGAGIDLASVKDPKARAAMEAISKQLEPVKGYRATVANKGLSLFADLNPSTDEQIARPGKLRVVRTIEMPFTEGSPIKVRITYVLDGTWTLMETKGELTASQQKGIEKIIREQSDKDTTEAEIKEALEEATKEMQQARRLKYNVKTLAEQGEITVPGYFAAMGDLFNPFAQYKPETIALEKETADAWVFVGECNYAMQPWAMTRLTVDKKTGFPTKLETDQNQFLQARSRIPIGQTDIIPLLEVQKITVANDLSDELFSTKAAADAEDATGAQLEQLQQRNSSVHMREKANAKKPQPAPSATKPSTPEARAASTNTSVITNSIGMQLALIPAGSFTMGSPNTEKSREEDEGPTHKVTISKPFYIGIYEVTQGEWEKVMGGNPGDANPVGNAVGKQVAETMFGSGPSLAKGTNLPVTMISWFDAQKFCEKLSKTENASYRLPTEAEWEYACRAGTTTPFFWGEMFSPRYAWCNQNSGNSLKTSGTRRPNNWGVFDMSGSVWEWCQDWYGAYDPTSQTDPKGPSLGDAKASRGGSYGDDPSYCRSARRSIWGIPGEGNAYIGLRVVREK